jgi:hypothetical protein
MDTQTDTQTPPQAPAHRYRKGRSGNPSGVSRTQRIYVEMAALYVTIHSRQPNRVEVVSLRNAAALSARIEGNRIPVEEIVRAGNLLARLTEKLGLDRRPEPPAGFNLPPLEGTPR